MDKGYDFVACPRSPFREKGEALPKDSQRPTLAEVHSGDNNAFHLRLVAS